MLKGQAPRLKHEPRSGKPYSPNSALGFWGLGFRCCPKGPCEEGTIGNAHPEKGF